VKHEWSSSSVRVGLFVLLGLTTTLLPACNERAIESWLSEGQTSGTLPSLYSDEAFPRAMSEIRKRLPAPVQVLSLLVYSDHLVLQAEDPAARGSALQYVYRAGTLSVGVPVKLLGTGRLEDNVFPLDAAKVSAVPRLARAAQKKADIPEGTVARVLLKRNLPESMDIQFRVFVTSQRRDAYIDANQEGTLLE
jgi:hypothetical protein